MGATGGQMAELSWRDLRDWLSIVDELGELRHVEGASWQEDVGAVTELLDHSPESPAALFDAIPGYPRGYRVLTKASANPKRASNAAYTTATGIGISPLATGLKRFVGCPRSSTTSRMSLAA